MSDFLLCRCGECRQELRIPARYAGKRDFICPQCQASFRVPTRRELEDTRSVKVRYPDLPPGEEPLLEESYALDGNLLRILDPTGPWLELLAVLTDGLEGTEDDPIRIDLTGSKQLDAALVRRVFHAQLQATLANRPARIEVTSSQLARIHEIGIAELAGIFEVAEPTTDARPGSGRRAVDRSVISYLLPKEDGEEDEEPAESYTGPDRRKESRFRVGGACVEIEGREVDTEETDDLSLLVDLSPKGCRFTTPHRLTEGDEVTLTILLPDSEKPLQVEGRIVWVEKPEGEKQFHTGVLFTILSSSASIKLRRLKADFSG